MTSSHCVQLLQHVAYLFVALFTGEGGSVRNGRQLLSLIVAAGIGIVQLQCPVVRIAFLGNAKRHVDDANEELVSG